jgi:hypothetical protein
MKIYTFSEAYNAPNSVQNLRLSLEDTRSAITTTTRFPNLETLIVIDYECTVIPPTKATFETQPVKVINWEFLSNFPTVKNLILSNFPLREIPPELIDLPNVKTLEIAIQYPQSIDRIISDLARMSSLSEINLEGSIFEPGHEDKIIKAFPYIKVAKTSYSSIFDEDPNGN